jgi:hypothetical protein
MRDLLSERQSFPLRANLLGGNIGCAECTTENPDEHRVVALVATE